MLETPITMDGQRASKLGMPDEWGDFLCIRWITDRFEADISEEIEQKFSRRTNYVAYNPGIS